MGPLVIGAARVQPCAEAERLNAHLQPAGRTSVRPLLHADRARAQSRVRRHAHRQSGAWRFSDAGRVPGVLAVHAVCHQSGSRGGHCVRRLRDRGLAALLSAGAAAPARQRPGNAVVHPVLRPVAGDRSSHHHRLRHQRAVDPRQSARPRDRHGRKPVRRARGRKRTGRSLRPNLSSLLGGQRHRQRLRRAAASIFICTARGSAI